MTELDKEKIVLALKNFRTKKLAVIGDLAIDEMIYGDCERISREAPVLILQHSNTKIILGGASNAANNISSLNNGNVSVVGVCGCDYHSEILKNALENANINTKYLFKDKTRKTIVKTRISGSCSQSITQQIVRIDRQTNDYVSGEIEQNILNILEEVVKEHDAIVLSDYHICTLTRSIISKTIELCKKYNKIVVADLQKNFEYYQGVTSMTPNQPDCEKFTGFFIKDDKTLKNAGKSILERTNCESLLITRGEFGMAIFDKSGNITKIDAYNKTKVFDVTGAGDTVVATYTLGLASGLNPVEAAFVANIAASIVIRYFGCATTTVDILLENIDKFVKNSHNKEIFSWLKRLKI